MSETFQLAIIGAGGIAGAHASAAAKSGGRVAVAAAVDPDPAARNKIAAECGAQTFDSVASLLKAGRAGFTFDGAVVCTPPGVRVEIIKALVKAGLPVLSEKPIAHTLADARRIGALAKGRRVLAVGYCHRFTPAVLKMRELTASGKIGRLTRFENVFACDLPGHQAKWFSDPRKAGGGAFLDMGSHSLDLFRFMVGEGRIVGAAFDHAWKGRAETAATVVLKCTRPAKGAGANTKAGVAGSIFSGWAETSRFTLALSGTGGMLWYDYEKPDELIFRDPAGKPEVIPVQESGVRFTNQLLAFADAASRGEKTNLATFADGVATAALNDAAAKAAKKK